MKKLLLTLLFFTYSFYYSYSQLYTDKYIADANKIALNWLNDINHGNYESAYNILTKENKDLYPKEHWIKQINQFMLEFGKIKNRAVISKNFTSSMEGMENGFYVVIEYDSDYQKTINHKELLILKQNDNMNWKILLYDNPNWSFIN